MGESVGASWRESSFDADARGAAGIASRVGDSDRERLASEAEASPDNVLTASRRATE